MSFVRYLGTEALRPLIVCDLKSLCCVRVILGYFDYFIFAGPQTTPEEFAMLGKTYQCVTLTWEAPQYPNGYISHYQVCKI